MKRILCSLLVATLPFGSVLAAAVDPKASQRNTDAGHDIRPPSTRDENARLQERE